MQHLANAIAITLCWIAVLIWMALVGVACVILMPLVWVLGGVDESDLDDGPVTVPAKLERPAPFKLTEWNQWYQTLAKTERN